MRIFVLRALDDNYMYLIVDESTRKAAIVDPVEHAKVLQAVDDNKVDLTTVLTTHHHWDHAGGNAELVALKKGLQVLGGDANINGLTQKVTHGDEFQIGNLKVKCLLTPCHTKGHICYYIEDPSGGYPAVFTGDTLFFAGCGKFFEGTAKEMYDALVVILGALPDETQVYCGHEYTVNNLLYASHVEPENEHIKDKLVWALGRKKANEPTVPSTIGDEKLLNPFMRVNQDEVKKHAKMEDPVAVMEFLRAEKNNFKRPNL